MSPLLVGLALAAGAPAPKDRPPIAGALVGEWAVLEVGGRPPAGPQAVEFTADGKVMFRAGPRPPNADRYRADPARAPAEIDIDPFDTHQLSARGIYRVAGDTLTLCLAHGGPRPTRFESPAGSKVTLMTLQRVKTKD